MRDFILALLGFVLLLLLCISVAQKIALFDGFVYQVPRAYWVQYFDDQPLYAWIHIAVILPVLLLSFDKKVAYFKKWKYLWFPVLVVALGFIAWDIWFASLRIWGFNERYLTGFHLVGLPWEECLFFITIPFASIFIYTCLRAYFPGLHLRPLIPLLTVLLAGGMTALGLYYFQFLYTSFTCLLTALVLVLILWSRQYKHLGVFYISFLITLVPFLLVDGALTGAFTEEPVVLYHPQEFSGIRIISIPVEDAIYGFLMLLLMVSGYEYLQKKPNVVPASP